MNHLWNLQLFAEGGASAAPAASAGGGGGSGASAAQPSEARLRELGVPEERLQKRAKRTENRKATERNGESPLIASQSVPPLGKGGNDAGEAVPQMGERSLSQNRTDFDTASYTGEAREVLPRKRSYDIRGHYDGMHRQAAEMAAKYPDFDLQKELDNPTFLRLTGPEIGLPLEDAYMAMHHRELTRAIAERSRMELSNSIRAGSARPAEHGMEAKAPSVVTFDYKNASKSQRAAFKKQIFDAYARGEKIYPVR